MLDYLREESNMMPRLGAVGIGGLTGLIFSLRGGKFKRFLYTSTGALSVASVCYPKQAQESLTLVKHYANIGYNFVYGGKAKYSDFHPLARFSVFSFLTFCLIRFFTNGMWLENFESPFVPPSRCSGCERRTENSFRSGTLARKLAAPHDPIKKSPILSTDQNLRLLERKAIKIPRILPIHSNDKFRYQELDEFGKRKNSKKHVLV